MIKIADLPTALGCAHPEHVPPMHIVLDPGVYAHTCPSCGSVQTIVINPSPTLCA